MKIAVGIVGALFLLGLGYWFLLRPWSHRWGATVAETTLRLPGDELSPEANMISTRAVTVRAPAAEIYPWLVQLGQGRGGMYSYEWLENLAGCNIHNVYQIRSELQQVEPGQEIRMGPEGYPFYQVYAFDPGRYYAMQPGDPVSKRPAPASWVLYLQEQPDGTTRLISRQRQRVEPGLGNFITWKVIVDPLGFIMEQKMLRSIRDLAEAQA